LSYASSDSLTIDAAGKARRETSVFGCNQMVNEQFSPYRFELSSMGPSISYTDGRADTVTSFILSAVVHAR
jgi:hypothetical protein